MSAEQIPIQNMEKQKSKISDKKGLVDQLLKLAEDVRGNIAVNANARSLRELKVETNNDIIGVIADKNRALPGTYQIEVLSLAQKSSAMSSGFEDRDNSYVGVGFIQYKLPNGETKDIYIDSSNASLIGVAKLINKETKMGITANVINDGSGSETPWRLLLSLQSTGDESNAEFPYFYFVDGDQDFQLESQRDAHDAKIKLDGFEIEASEDKLKELIPGLTIDLKKAKPGEEFSIKITEDLEAVGVKVGDLIAKLNGILKFIKDQNTLDDKTDTSRTLGGDIMLQSLESRIHSAVFKDVMTDTGYHRVGELGLGFNRDGSIEFDAKKFQTLIGANYTLATQILTGTFTGEGGKSEGFMDNLNATMGSALRTPDGLIQSRKKSLQGSIEQIDRRINQKQKYLEEKEKSLKDKFSRLEGTISKIKSQGAGVAALGGADPVTQLG